MPNYTSRQDSRTGLPGVRCDDVPLDEFLTAPWWNKAVNAARKKINEKKSTHAEDRLLVDLRDKWAGTPEDQPKRRTVRLPRRGGDLFVAAPPASCRANGHRPCPLCRGSRALQADLNAAANIGLRALLDPDFPGKWWYIPAAMDNDGWRAPAGKSCTGATCLEGWKVAPNDGYFSADGQPFTPADDETVKKAQEELNEAKKEHSRAKRAAKKNRGADQAAVNNAEKRYDDAKKKLKDVKKAASQKEIVNVWHDPTAQRISPPARRWRETKVYWNGVRARAVSILRRVNDLDATVDAADVPW